MKTNIFVCTILLIAAANAFAVNPQSERIREFPVAMQCWTFHEFTFFETIDKVKELDIHYLQPYPGQPMGKEMPNAVFGPDLTDAQIDQVKNALQEKGITLAAFGVIGFDNNEQGMRKVFDFAKKMEIPIIVTEPAYDDYSLIEKMVQEYNIKIAIHNHPTPSKYARPETVFAHIKGLDKRIGVCADTGHWMRTGINPIEALQVLEGRIIDVHLKDLNEFGDKKAFDVPFGQGKADVSAILAELSRQNYRGCLAIEHENPKELKNPSPSIKKGLDYIQSITYYKGYEEILPWDDGKYSKHGWNHYGPGYFDLCEKCGVLKSHGGMGLFWYSVRKYKDFILELDYKCESVNTNSGIFLRVPELISSNEYISQSFEIQIYDAGEGIHKTGAVYDAEAPSASAFNKPGEWNHYKITFKGSTITVELNGVKIVDWNAEPRGKIKSFTSEGYIGLQNHDDIAPVYFKNIFVKEIQ